MEIDGAESSFNAQTDFFADGDSVTVLLRSTSTTKRAAEPTTLAERALRGVADGTSSVLVQSELQEHHLVGRSFPIEAQVKFYPLSSKDQCRVLQFGTTVLCGIFMEYALNEGEVGLVNF